MFLGIFIYNILKIGLDKNEGLFDNTGQGGMLVVLAHQLRKVDNKLCKYAVDYVD